MGKQITFDEITEPNINLRFGLKSKELLTVDVKYDGLGDSAAPLNRLTISRNNSLLTNAQNRLIDEYPSLQPTEVSGKVGVNVKAVSGEASTVAAVNNPQSDARRRIEQGFDSDRRELYLNWAATNHAKGDGSAKIPLGNGDTAKVTHGALFDYYEKHYDRNNPKQVETYNKMSTMEEHRDRFDAQQQPGYFKNDPRYRGGAGLRSSADEGSTPSMDVASTGKPVTAKDFGDRGDHFNKALSATNGNSDVAAAIVRNGIDAKFDPKADISVVQSTKNPDVLIALQGNGPAALKADAVEVSKVQPGTAQNVAETLAQRNPAPQQIAAVEPVERQTQQQPSRTV
jgi:hypothetical protein